MNMKSPNLLQMEAAWQAYVNTDPELYRLEHRKQVIEHRRIRKAHAKQVRVEAGREIVRCLAETSIRAAICTVGVVVFMVMLFCG